MAVAAMLTAKLQSAFAPTFLRVENESSGHNVASGAETHFKVIVISSNFSGMPPLDCHRSVNETLAEELSGPVHALSIVAKTPEKWAKSQSVPVSPDCIGGYGR